LDTESNTLVVPLSLVFEENGASFVFVQDHDGWTKRPVELGLASYTTIAVHSGLHQGEAVALQPSLVAQSMK
jgi:hypothetical protein